MSDFHRDETRHYKQLPGSRNCMQCAVAYMLGLPLAEVPDFVQAGSEAWEAFYAFFADRGFTAEMFPPNVEIGGDYLASGETARGTSHMVVMRGGQLLHDPHPSNAGLTAVQVVWLIVRRAGQTGADALRRERDELAARLETIEQAEPVAWLYHDARTAHEAHPWLHSTMVVLNADRRPGLRGETPLYTRPSPAAAPERAEPAAPTCETNGLLGATSGVGRECDYWAGGVCTSPEPCQHQQPVKPCRTCGPDACSDSTSCPRGER